MVRPTKGSVALDELSRVAPHERQNLSPSVATAPH